MDHDKVLYEIAEIKQQNAANKVRLRKLQKIAKAHTALARSLDSLKPKAKKPEKRMVYSFSDDN